MHLPLFGLELDSGDITQFERVSEAESYIESYDIDTWRVFDALGQMCSIEPSEPSPMVRLTLKPSETAQAIVPAIVSYLARPSTSGTKAETALRMVLDRLQDPRYA